MPVEIRMPRLGWTMEEGAFGEWLKPDGADVAPGDPLFTVEGDKATQEVEAFDAGILHIPPDGPQPGQVLPVGARLGYILQPGEALPSPGGHRPDAIVPQVQIEEQSAALAPTQPSIEKGMRTLQAISPRARRVADELGVDWTQLAGSGRTGRIVERDVRAAAQAAAQTISQDAVQQGDKLRVSPLAQRVAAAAGIDLADVAAQHPGARIQRDQVEAAIAARSAAAPEIADSETADERLPVTRLRHLIAQRMLESAQTTAAVTLTSEADATALVALREQIKAAFTPRGWDVPSYTDLLIKLTALALQEHPRLNATWQGDEIILHGAVHLGLAVDTEPGLVAPVVRDAQAKSVRQIAGETRALVEQAQANRLGPDDLRGGTFTLTNLGMYSVDFFTPLINLPQCAILGVGRIAQKPAVYQGQVVPRSMLALSLTFDHRVVDGAPAARFLDTVRQFVETPALWMMG
ncbi:MAG: 2-oxo acid dehydrogenase subunit E2 [Caldilineaceae bacterium]|nr:2-oxo acid dehydrogenase subunit E2 [Caldilineaceae bacterium]